MKLHRLEIEGFGPFRERQVVDFDAFADDGIFLIGGRTGAGKSSVLDAICFGLYGSVPRYDTGEKRLRSDHSEPGDLSEVVVEFSTTCGRYRVTRSPEYERPKSRGSGMTTERATAALDIWRDGEWVGVAARAVDVGRELGDIVQLSVQQFLQVILLAQNRFARFLLADSKERQALLRRLFGTERFEDVQKRLDERRRDAAQALETLTAALDARLSDAQRLAEQMLHDDDLVEGTPSGDTAEALAPSTSSAMAQQPGPPTDPVPDRLEQLRASLTRGTQLTRRREEAQRQAAIHRDAADLALTEAKERRRHQEDRVRARREQATLIDAAAQIHADEQTLQAARSAETLRAVLAATRRADDILTDAETTLQRHQDQWRAATHDDPEAPDETDAAVLRRWATTATRESGAWHRAAQLETEHTQRAREREQQQTALNTVVAAQETIDAECAELPSQLDVLTRSRDEERRTADLRDDLRRRLDEAAARTIAAHEAQALQAEVHHAEAAVVTAGDLVQRSHQQLQELRRRRLAGFAGELAAQLVDNQACAVCGSTTHPSPAEHTDPVSADDITAAEDTHQRAVDAERVANDHAATLRTNHATALARAAQLTPVEAEAAQEKQADELAAAQEAARRVTALDAEITTLTQRRAALDESRVTLGEQQNKIRQALAALDQTLLDADAQITAARGEFASVAERLRHIEQRITLASGLAETLEAHHRAVISAKESLAAQQSALADSMFADATEAEKALRTAAEHATLEQRITAHRVAEARIADTLRDLDALDLPDELIDLAPLLVAARTAQETLDAAVKAWVQASGDQERLGELIAAAESEHARSARQRADFAVLSGLSDAVAGRGQNTHRMTLETFVLAAELEDIVAAANLRLFAMSDGRYQLRHSDARAAHGAASGLGIVVHDAFTGQSRPAQSLSGGETFLSSLALALGLAEVVTSRAGGIRLDTLFIDEGFGSLDADTLDVAMRTLDELRQGGRTVGVISHVEAMQEQIPAQLRVRTTPGGPSLIDTTALPDT